MKYLSSFPFAGLTIININDETKITQKCMGCDKHGRFGLMLSGNAIGLIAFMVSIKPYNTYCGSVGTYNLIMRDIKIAIIPGVRHFTSIFQRNFSCLSPALLIQNDVYVKKNYELYY